MGEIVFAGAAAHAPGLTGWFDRAPPATQEEVRAGYARLGEEIRAARPDVLILVANDHLANYEPSDYPDLVFGTAATQVGPAEWFRAWLALDEYRIPGAPELARTLYDELRATAGVRVEVNDEFYFDDNVSVPVVLTGFKDAGIPLLPVIQNCTVPPVPGSRAVYEIGRQLAEAIRTRTPDGFRVALLGSGGLSHEPGGPRYLEIDEAFDRWFMDLLVEGDHEKVLSEVTWERMEQSGAGGTAELLSWMVVMGAIGEQPCEALCYACVPEWRCGVGAVRWDVPALAGVA